MGIAVEKVNGSGALGSALRRGIVLILATGCAAAGPRPATPAPPAPAAAAPASPASAVPTTTPAAAPAPGVTRLSALAVREQPELRAELEAERVVGTIALFDTESGVLSCSDVERCRKRHLPASTFKIANSIIALETGVASDPETLLKWDGVERQNESWNQDMTLRRAIQVSCLPCFQGIARQVGDARMRDWVMRLDYGNHDISGGIDRFWLWGGLRITPIEELDFLRRLDTGALPIQNQTREMVLDMITLDATGDYVLRGKTGAALMPEEPETIGWLVGWLELGARRIYFATAIDSVAEGVDFLKVRRQVTERVLRRLGVLPAQ